MRGEGWSAGNSLEVDDRRERKRSVSKTVTQNEPKKTEGEGGIERSKGMVNW